MDINNFILDEKKIIESDLIFNEKYKQLFPNLSPLDQLYKNRKTLVLESIQKKKIKEFLPCFLDIISNYQSSNALFPEDDDFYNNSDSHFLYKFSLSFPGPQDKLRIHFHSLSSDDFINDYLDSYQDSYILNSNLRSRAIESIVKSDFKQEYLSFTDSIDTIINQDSRYFDSISESTYKKDLVKSDALMLFLTLSLMKQKNHSPHDVFSKTENLKVGSRFIYEKIKKLF